MEQQTSINGGGIDSYMFLYFLISSLVGMHIYDHRLDGFMINASRFYCHFLCVKSTYFWSTFLVVKSQFFWWVKSKISALMVLVMKSQLFGLSRPGLSHGASEDLQLRERT